MKQHAKAVNIGLLFIMVQIILYVFFLVLDLTGGNIYLSSDIKFTIIILCFCYALFTKGNDKSISFCLKTALLFTVISDLFILILDYYFYGVLTFIIVQQLYSIRLSINKYRDKGDQKQVAIIKSFAVRLAVQIILAAVLCLILQSLDVILEPLLIASIFYFISFLMNVIRAVMAAISNSKDKGMVLFAVGISLFLLCDINVGLFNLSGYISMSDNIYAVVYSLSSILMWTFYAPSQVLIALSIKENRI